MKKEIKTNAMRVLDKLNINYEHIDYGLEGDFVSSVDLSEKNSSRHRLYLQNTSNYIKHK